MLRNIHTGWGGVKKRSSDEIIILVSSLHHVQSLGLSFLFTDYHAYIQYSEFYSDLSDLNKIDWTLLQNRDFKRDPNDPTKLDRYQAEALIHRSMPVTGLIGIVCYTEAVKQRIEQEIKARHLTLPVHARPNWYVP